MSKLFAVVLSVLFVVAAAVPVMATDARQAALAGTGNYIEDDYNIFTWYATLPSYSNTVWMGVRYLATPGIGELPTTYDLAKYIGASYGLGEEGKYGTVAMFLYDMAPGPNPFSESEELWTGNGLFNNGLFNKLTLMYGYPMDKLSLGIYLNRSDSYTKDEVDDASTENVRAYTTVGGGLRFDLGEKAYIDLAGDLTFVTYKAENTIWGDVKQDGNMMMGARGRMFYEWNETITWIPYINFRRFNFSLKAEDVDYDNQGDKALGFDLGLGANIKVNEDNLLIFAIEPYSFVKREPSEPPAGVSWDIKTVAFPRFFLALESDVKDWLTFRAGGMKALYAEKETYKEDIDGAITKEVYTSTWSDFGYFMGLGFHVSDFDIDCVINNELPFNIGYWLTGNSYDTVSNDNGYWQPMYMISAAYHF